MLASARLGSDPVLTRRTRVLIVDDSAVARAALSRMVGSSDAFDVRGTAADVDAALTHLARERVDLILLDLEMPRTSGLTALPLLLRAGQGARVLVVSSSAAQGATATLQALALGAADTLVKPAGGFADAFRDELLGRLAVLAAPLGDPDTPPPAPPPHAYQRTATLRPFDAIAIGASTGGIHALAALLAALPPTLTQPIFVTQHLPPAFSGLFASQLALWSGRPAALATDHARVRDGGILAAPGDAHLVVAPMMDGGVAARLSRAPAASGNLPAVDPMFTSLSEIYRERLLAVVLSGMGRDGLDGARFVRDAGGTVVVQDAETSVVWGMPGVVAEAGLADAVLPPARIGMLIARSLGTAVP